MKAIIPQPSQKPQPPGWQQALSSMVTDPMLLLALLNIEPQTISWEWNKNFPIRVTQSFIQRMKKGDPNDPLLLQVLSCPKESQYSVFYSKDPLRESKHNPVPGLLHKFSNRVLLTFTSSCAIHCRYCFRRHFPYEKNNPGRKGWGQALAYIEKRAEIIEVILSGGDPLMAQDEVLKDFLTELSQIPHVKLLRFHTRLPVVIPERINDSLINVLSRSRFQVTMVYHINHPQEINTEIANGVAQLREQQITVFNQAVLLHRINDDLNCLTRLSLQLYQAGILPYYVNLLDHVAGAEHFYVSREKAKILQRQLRNALPGYLVPKFVQEIPHLPCKMPLDLLT